MNELAEFIITAAKGLKMGDPLIAPPGRAIHHVGTCRMGANPSTSMLNSECQSHSIKNLYVTDGGIFPTCPEKNPTLTIMAVSLRAGEHLAAKLKRG
jgi:choline dehydrogenase-like flavoprotein